MKLTAWWAMNKKMHTFVYCGWSAQGEPVHSQIQASHIFLAKSALRAQGIWVKTIRKQYFVAKLNFSAQQLLLMTQQLAVLVNAHLPVTLCLITLAKQFKANVGAVFKQMIYVIEQGKSLSAALQLYPQLFPAYFAHLVQVGEESGRLGTVLWQLAHYQEKNLTQIQLLKKALLYPVCVFVISLFITIGLLLFIVPQFQLLFADMQSALPPLTRIVFHLSDFLQTITLWDCLLTVGSVLILYNMIKQNARCMRILQILLHHLPVIGPVIHDNQQTRYLRSLGIALEAGLPLLQALQLAEQVMAHTYLARKITRIKEEVQAGLNLQQAFTFCGQFSELVIQLVTIGEQTSQLHTLLSQSAQVLEQRIDKLMQQLTSILQPLLITLLGIILGSLIIALYLPIFKLGALY
jgi:type IV pilus assembly protein PilC